MPKNCELRESVRLIKARQGITFKELAEYLEIKQGSFLNWLNGWYELSEAKEQRLQEIIDTLQE